MIVVEGFDGAGKTTLSKALGEALGWPVYHTGGPTRDLRDVAVCLHRTQLRFIENCVQDRCTHISETVYSMLTKPEQASLALVHLGNMIALPRVVVYCRPDDAVLRENLLEHIPKAHDTAAHMEKVFTNADSLIPIYDTVMTYVDRVRREKKRTPIRVYKYGYDSVDGLIRSIKGEL